MKFSKETLSVLKTLSTINTNILLKPGSQLSTISPQKNVMADVTVAEDFPETFGIYDLSEFLGVISLFDEPDVTFKESYARIGEGSSFIKYYAADQSILVVSQKKINFPSAEVSFTLPAATLAMAMKTAGALRSSDISFVGNGKEVLLQVSDLKNDTANSFSTPVGETTNVFNANLKVDNLKMMPGEYEVSLTSKKISRFKHTSMDAVFYIALEATSKFEA